VNIDALVAAGGPPSSAFLAEYAALAAVGEFRIPIARRFPLDEWRAAAELSLSRAPHGKVVLIP
jgi:NADPH:quinone reductase-like Zn-dependent oxidoreductase